MMKIYINIKYLRGALLSGILLFIVNFSPAVNAQSGNEALAELHRSLRVDGSAWREGFCEFAGGTYSPYQSHRSGSGQDSAFVARTAGSETQITWLTAPLPAKCKKDSVSFIWACGFGNNLGRESFDLSINGLQTITFKTVNDPFWEKIGNGGQRLAFYAVKKNPNGANLGYMTLTVPASEFEKGKPLKLQITGRPASREVWYRLYKYSDIKNYILTNEVKTFYPSLELIHLGEAVYTLCAPEKLSGLQIRLESGNRLIADGRLEKAGNISKAVINIPRMKQPEAGEAVFVKIKSRVIDTIFWSEINNARLRAFMDEELVCDGYVFLPGAFPVFGWKNKIIVENELGVFPLKAEFYDAGFNRVNTAEKPGRYGAVVEGVAKDGFVIKRYATLFCSPVEFDDYGSFTPLIMNMNKGYGIDESKWKSYSGKLNRFSFGGLKMFPAQSPDAAILLAGLNEITPDTDYYNTPRNRDREWWIKLKRKLDGSEAKANPLPEPRRVSGREGTVITEQLIENEKTEKLRKICGDWAEKGGQANVTLVLHKGKIVFHEAFGTDEEGNKVTKNSKMWMASITKLLTGIITMQFVENGILGLDSPAGDYLPELSAPEYKELTLRRLLNHTSGLSFAGEWASDWNYSLENQIAQVMPAVKIGSDFGYNRVGYAVTGKIMERITGLPVAVIFNEYLFKPLGLKSAFSDNTYGGLYCTAEDLAAIGQMLLNKGIYKGIRFFSDATFEKMLPVKLSLGDRYWGAGTSKIEGRGLSEKAFGHFAASGSVFIIDPANELVIVSARNKPGKYHSQFEDELIKSSIDLIKNR
jgi:CubicO group peptidase (beta-lactamase class C family)